MLNLRQWYQARGPAFIWHRSQHLWDRYGFSTQKAEGRILDCMEFLAEESCAPTFPVPGMVVERHPSIISHLAEMGAEIAVHGYNHIDMHTLSPQKASQELLRAAQIFDQYGLPVHGFRCPYLSCSDELIRSIPTGVFKYSSNWAVRWRVPGMPIAADQRMVHTLDSFYLPRCSDQTICTPWMIDSLVEIPVCIPDDLQLFDGYQLNESQVSAIWTGLIDQTYHRGELFTLMFHPELFTRCINPLLAVLKATKRYSPKIWLARLAEIATWWLEKEDFTYQIEEQDGKISLNLNCSPRSTILLRDLPPGGIDVNDCQKAWEGRYTRISGHSFIVPSIPRPLVGVAPDVQSAEREFLREQGYLLDTSATAPACTVYLENDRVERLGSRLSLVDWIESSPGPLVRFWRWPDGYKSAFSISGDLDALSLLDYSRRLFSG